jgi:hypothetical protein
MNKEVKKTYSIDDKYIYLLDGVYKYWKSKEGKMYKENLQTGLVFPLRSYELPIIFNMLIRR